MHRDCEIIGVASGWGAENKGCEDGPESLYKKVAIKSCKVEQKYLWEILYPIFQEKHQKLSEDNVLPLITDINEYLSQAVFDSISKKYFPIVIGGDHSIAVGTWTGVKQTLPKGKNLGLIWIDSRMDLQVPASSDNVYWDNMPLSALLGCGDPAFFPKDVQNPVLLPENICLLCVRSKNDSERELMKRMNIKVFFMEEIKQKGFAEVMLEAVEIVTKNTDCFGVSLDMSAMDPKEAPGVSSPIRGGVVSTDLFKMLQVVINHPSLRAFEVVEFNPHNDRDERTACICLEILGRIMGSKKPFKK